MATTSMARTKLRLTPVTFGGDHFSDNVVAAAPSRGWAVWFRTAYLNVWPRSGLVHGKHAAGYFTPEDLQASPRVTVMPVLLGNSTSKKAIILSTGRLHIN